MADLAGMDAEIKKIEQVKNKYRSLLEIERKVNEAMLYSVGVRKKYTDALSATTSAQKNLMEKEHKLETQIVHTATSLQKSYGVQKKLLKEQEKLLAKQATTARTDPKFKEQEKRLKEIKRALSSNNKDIRLFKKYLTESKKEADKLKGNAKALETSFSELAKIDKSTISSSKDLNDLSLKRADIMKQQLDIQRKAGTISDEEAKDLKDKLSSMEQIQDIQGDLLKRNVSEDLAPMIDELTKSAKDLTSVKGFNVDPAKATARGRAAAESRMGVGLMGKQAQSLKSLFSARTSFGEKMGSLKSFKDAQKDMGKLNTVMGVTGKSAKTAGGMMKMLGTALGSLGKLGWIGLIISAVATIAKAVNELDKFIKSFNQTFAKLQGPTVMMQEVGKSMKEFTSSIFDLQRNLKYGLRSEEILGMFQAVSEAGMSLQGVMKNVAGGYDKLIEDAAKVHLNFGVSMEEAGSMLGEQMTDLRSSVDEASEGFKILSYDASIAGIQSQKFYQATYAAAEALSYYGKFLESASNTLKKFQEQGGMGFKDAQKQTQTMTNLFKDMDKNMRVAFIEMSGGVEEYRKDFIKLERDSRKAVEEHLTKIAARREDLEDAKRRGDEDTVKRIQNEIKAEEAQLTVAQKTMAMAGSAAKSNAQDMAMYLEMISDKAGEKMGDYFKMLMRNNGPNVFSTSTRAMVEHMKAILPISDEFAMQMIGTVKTSRVGIEQMARDMKGLVDTLPEGKESTFGKDIQNIIEKNVKDGKMNMDAIRKGLETYSRQTGTDTGMIYDYLNKFPNAIQEFLKKGYQGVMANIEGITLDELKNVEQITGEGDKEQEKRLDDVVKNTHTIGDFLDINAEYLKKIVATSGAQDVMAGAAMATARSTGSILNFLIGKWGKTGKMKAEERKAKEVEDVIFNKKMMENLLSKTTDKGMRQLLRFKIMKMEDEIEIVSGGKKSMVADASFKAEERAQEQIKREKEAEAKKKEAEAKKTKTEADINMMETKAKKRSLPPVIPKAEEVKPEGDYKANRGGYALLSKGDVVVNARNMSTGVSGDIGSFAGTAASEMMRSFSSGDNMVAAPTIPVNISIGSISGDPEEFLKAIKPAIEQAFERMYFDKQKRK